MVKKKFPPHPPLRGFDILVSTCDVAVPPNIQFKEEWVNTHLLEGFDIIVLRRDGCGAIDYTVSKRKGS